jgi:hypothetical protein
MNTDFKSLCTPAKIYFAIAIVSFIIALFNHMSILAVFINLMFAFLWTYVLGWLCEKGYKSVSWFLVLLPYVVILLGMMGVMSMASQRSVTQMRRQVKM